MRTNLYIPFHMLLLQCDWHSPHWEAGPVFLDLSLGELETAPTKRLWQKWSMWLLRLSQTKETASTWLSITGNSPMEPSHHAANKSKLVHAERPHGEARMERNCGPKWHLVPAASWVHEPSDDSCSQLHIFYLMSQASGKRKPALLCPVQICYPQNLRA